MRVLGCHLCGNLTWRQRSDNWKLLPARYLVRRSDSDILMGELPINKLLLHDEEIEQTES